VLKGFRDFIARGNVIDLAVGIVIGAAFTALVGVFVTQLVSPLVGAFGSKSLAAYSWCIKDPCTVDATTGAATSGVAIGWGAMLAAIITFLITAAVVYFVFVVPMNKFRARNATPEEEAEAEEITLLREIRDSLKAQGNA
jgi:large conductance mechanosensitive channel